MWTHWNVFQMLIFRWKVNNMLSSTFTWPLARRQLRLQRPWSPRTFPNWYDSMSLFLFEIRRRHERVMLNTWCDRIKPDRKKNRRPDMHFDHVVTGQFLSLASKDWQVLYVKFCLHKTIPQNMQESGDHNGAAAPGSQAISYRYDFYACIHIHTHMYACINTIY